MDPLHNLTPDSIRALFTPEYRVVVAQINDLQWRESGSGDGSRILDGYPSVYDTTTCLYDGTYYRLEERLDDGAFDNVLMRDPLVHFNLGHDMNTSMASTHVRSGVGCLELKSVSGKGLHAYARLNQADPDVIRLAAKMDTGVMTQMSFAFRVKPSGYTITTTADANGKETDLRVIHEIAELYDVCVCAQGAYPTTEASLRSLLQSMETGAHVLNREVVQAGEGAREAVSPEAVGAETPQVDWKREGALAHVRAVLATNPNLRSSHESGGVQAPRG